MIKGQGGLPPSILKRILIRKIIRLARELKLLDFNETAMICLNFFAESTNDPRVGPRLAGHSGFEQRRINCVVNRADEPFRRGSRCVGTTAELAWHCEHLIISLMLLYRFRSSEHEPGMRPAFESLKDLSDSHLGHLGVLSNRDYSDRLCCKPCLVVRETI